MTLTVGSNVSLSGLAKFHGLSCQTHVMTVFSKNDATKPAGNNQLHVSYLSKCGMVGSSNLTAMDGIGGNNQLNLSDLAKCGGVTDKPNYYALVSQSSFVKYAAENSTKDNDSNSTILLNGKIQPTLLNSTFLQNGKVPPALLNSTFLQNGKIQAALLNCSSMINGCKSISQDNKNELYRSIKQDAKSWSLSELAEANGIKKITSAKFNQQTSLSVYVPMQCDKGHRRTHKAMDPILRLSSDTDRNKSVTSQINESLSNLVKKHSSHSLSGYLIFQKYASVGYSAPQNTPYEWLQKDNDSHKSVIAKKDVVFDDITDINVKSVLQPITLVDLVKCKGQQILIENKTSNEQMSKMSQSRELDNYEDVTFMESIQIRNDGMTTSDGQDMQCRLNDIQHEAETLHVAVEVLVCGPSILGKSLCCKAVLRKQLQEADIKYKRQHFCYHYQTKHIAGRSSMSLKAIVPFDFSLSSPDDKIKSKHTLAFSCFSRHADVEQLQ